MQAQASHKHLDHNNMNATLHPSACEQQLVALGERERLTNTHSLQPTQRLPVSLLSCCRRFPSYQPTQEADTLASTCPPRSHTLTRIPTNTNTLIPLHKLHQVRLPNHLWELQHAVLNPRNIRLARR